MIQSYFDQIKASIDQYAATVFVLGANVNFETRPGEQGYVAGSVTFVDASVLHFTEFLDAFKGTVDKLMYTYHYQNTGNQLIFRYDNARHRPLLRSPEHKHTLGQVVETPAPTLDGVLIEIAEEKEWL